MIKSERGGMAQASFVLRPGGMPHSKQDEALISRAGACAGIGGRLTFTAPAFAPQESKRPGIYAATLDFLGKFF